MTIHGLDAQTTQLRRAVASYSRSVKRLECDSWSAYCQDRQCRKPPVWCVVNGFDSRDWRLINMNPM